MCVWQCEMVIRIVRCVMYGDRSGALGDVDENIVFFKQKTAYEI